MAPVEFRKYELSGITPQQLEKEIDSIWKELQNDPEARAFFEKEGESDLASAQRSQYINIRRDEAGLGGAEILIEFAIAVAAAAFDRWVLSRIGTGRSEDALKLKEKRKAKGSSHGRMGA